MKPIALAEQFIDGLWKKDVSLLPLHVDASLYTALDPARVIVGKKAICDFLENETFPLTPPNDPHDPPKIERHVVDGNVVCSMFSLKTKDTIFHILDYFEIQDDLIYVIRPYYQNLHHIKLQNDPSPSQ